MGEYALHHGERVKIGTCEDMYYLRADQVDQVAPLSGNVDPVADGYNGSLRFRFPFPDEDHIAPGAFDRFERAVTAHGCEVPGGVEHYPVQFTSPKGYVMSVPCPESSAYTTHDGGLRRTHTATGTHVGRNGFAGTVRVQQQKWFDGRLITVCSCGGCGTAWRVETAEMAEPIITAFAREADEADRRERIAGRPVPSSEGDWYREMAIRVARGYTTPHMARKTA